MDTLFLIEWCKTVPALMGAYNKLIQSTTIEHLQHTYVHAPLYDCMYVGCMYVVGALL